MKIFQENSTMVLAGSWNPAILTPQWIAQTVFGLKAGESFPVEIDMIVANGAMQKMRFLGLSCVASSQFLIFFFDSQNTESCSVAVKSARKILEVLSHTPVTGVGFNMQFLLSETKPEFLNRFQSIDLDDEVPGADVVSKGWSMKLNTVENLISITSTYEGGSGRIEMNFHHSATTADEARAYLADDNKCLEIFGVATAVAKKLSNEEMEA